MKKYKRKRNRRQYALMMLTLVLLAGMIHMSVNGGSLFAERAKRDMEVREGWGTTELIWRKQVSTTLEGNRSICLYTIEDAFIIAEQSWSPLEGWYTGAMAKVETRENRPVQAGFEFYQEGETCIMYLAGKITDADVDPENITYQLWWYEQAREEYRIRPEDCFQNQGDWYFVRAIDVSDKESPMSCIVLSRVMDDNGEPICWDDGYADDYGEWMVVSESTYVDQ